jgi:hypothetical protein
VRWPSFIGPSFIARILSSAFARNSVRREIPLASAASSTSALAAWTDAEQVREKLLGALLGNGEVVDTWGIGLGERLDVLGTLFGAHTRGLLHEIGQPPLQHYLSQCLAPDVSITAAKWTRVDGQGQLIFILSDVMLAPAVAREAAPRRSSQPIPVRNAPLRRREHVVPPVLPFLAMSNTCPKYSCRPLMYKH